MAERNLCPNPACGSATTPLAGWNLDNAGITATAVSNRAAPFPRVTACKWVVQSDGWFAETARAQITSDQTDVSAGLWLATSSGTRVVNLSMDVYNTQNGGNGQYAGECTNSSASVTLTTTPQYFKIEGAQNFTDGSWVNVTVSDGDGKTSGTIFCSGVRFVNATTVGDYADGDSPGWAWDGTAEASTSSQSSAPVFSGSVTASLSLGAGKSAQKRSTNTRSASVALSVSGAARRSQVAAAEPHLSIAATAVGDAGGPTTRSGTVTASINLVATAVGGKRVSAAKTAALVLHDPTITAKSKRQVSATAALNLQALRAGMSVGAATIDISVLRLDGYAQIASSDTAVVVRTFDATASCPGYSAAVAVPELDAAADTQGT